MSELRVTHPWLYEEFHLHDNHVLGRTSGHWNGLLTDLTIEQCMKSSEKSRRANTWRGMLENVCAMRIHSLHMCGSIHDAMTKLKGTEHRQCSQHEDILPSRIARDNKDLQSLITWLDCY